MTTGLIYDDITNCIFLVRQTNNQAMNNARQWLEHTVNLYPQFKIVDFSRTSIKDFLARLMQQNNLNGIVDGDIEYWDFVSNYFSAVGIFLPLNDKR